MSNIEKKDKSIAKKSRGPDISSMRRRKGSIGSSSNLMRTITKAGGGPAPFQAVMMFDITGSMYKYFENVREKLSRIVTEVKKEVLGSEFAVFAYRNHGDDFYDEIFYTSQLTSTLDDILSRISTIKKGGGGPDGLTCMEDCLQEANRLSWNTGSPKALVVIGDMPPHGVTDSKSKCPMEIDYENEVKRLKEKGIKIYSVFCQGIFDPDPKIKQFYRWIADFTGGKYLEISEIDILVDLLIGICMKETGRLQKYMTGLRQGNRLTGSTQKALRMLTDGR